MSTKQLCSPKIHYPTAIKTGNASVEPTKHHEKPYWSGLVETRESQSKPGIKMVYPEPCFKNQEGGYPQLLLAGAAPY